MKGKRIVRRLTQVVVCLKVVVPKVVDPVYFTLLLFQPFAALLLFAIASIVAAVVKTN